VWGVSTSESEPAGESPQAPKLEIPAAGKPKRRKILIVTIVVAVIVIAAISVWAIIYLGTGSLSVSSTSPFVAAKSAASFQAVITTPALVSAGAVGWQFGDGTNTSSAATDVGHTYAFPGNFFVFAASSLSNGKAVDNSMSLFPMQVGPAPVTDPNPLGEASALGTLTVNKTGSSTGAPLIAAGGSIRFHASIHVAPDFAWSDEVNSITNEWYNYSWTVTSLTIDFGDGSTPSTNTSTPFDETATGYPYEVTHQYNTAGLYAVTLSVTTQNYSFHQVDGVPAEPTSTPVSPAQTLTTTVGQSVAVGNYKLVSYNQNIVNPGTIVNMEATTGGTWTLDPSINYVGSEPIINIYQTLLAYNYTSTTEFVPIIADSIPTVANGGISADFMNYTFHIRQGIKFSDGTPVTPWDVKYSFTRTMLFVAGSPPTPGWLISQFLIPTDADGNWLLSYANVNGAVSIDNSSQTVTFHLVTPAPPVVFYEIITSTLGCGIASHTWLENVGPKIVWSDAGFSDYQKYGELQNWVSAWRNGAVGSGPYMIDYVANPDAIVLKVNPNFTPVPGDPQPTVSKIVIQYVADDSTRELSLQTGKADIATISSSRYAVASSMARQGLIYILPIPSMTLYWWNFNMEIYQSGTPQNPYGNSVPPNFFVDLNMRKAFFYAYNFQQYINQILGNGVYNTKFGELYNGIIPNGMPGYVNYSSMDTYSMTLAHQYYNQTQWVKDRGWATSGFTLALNVGQEDPIASAAATMWAQSLEQLAPAGQIHITTNPITDAEVTADAVPHANPMAIYSVGFGWAPDYPWPTDYTVPMLLPGITYDTPYGGYYTATNGFNIEYFQGDANGTGQVANMTKMLNWIDDSTGANATNLDLALWESQQANLMGMNLTLYVPEFQLFNHVYYRTWITGMEKEANPLLGGQWLLYAYLSKPSGVASSSVPSGTSILGYLIVSGLAGPPLIALQGTRRSRTDLKWKED
jgi:peptide/nickel transport system substrate-binding protein